MAMDKNGLTKLVEECGELTQIAAKKSAYMDSDIHPDGKGSMKKRMEDEIADVLAACKYVSKKFELDESYIDVRSSNKLRAFKKWDKQS